MDSDWSKPMQEFIKKTKLFLSKIVGTYQEIERLKTQVIDLTQQLDHQKKLVAFAKIRESVKAYNNAVSPTKEKQF